MATEQVVEQVPKTDEAEFQAKFLGTDITFRYSTGAVAYAILTMRVVMGWIFLVSGLDKLFADDWTASGFLEFSVHADNPLRQTFMDMADSGLVDALNVYGQILIGAALILGIVMRWSAFWGAVMMVLYWLASLQGGLGDALAVEYGWIVDHHLVYAAMLLWLGAIGAGRIFGVDASLEKSEFVRANRWTRWLLG